MEKRREGVCKLDVAVLVVVGSVFARHRREEGGDSESASGGLRVRIGRTDSRISGEWLQLTGSVLDPKRGLVARRWNEKS